MNRFSKIVLVGAAAIVVFDAAASIASRMMDFSYASASFASYLLYAIVGFRVGRQFPLGRAAIAGSVLGVVDASLGWATAIALRANAPPTPRLTPALWVIVAITVAITAAVCGLVGGAIGKATRKPPAAAVEQ